MNFIFVKLCDNDFGYSLKEAAEYVFENKEVDLTEEEFKYYVVNYVVFKQSVRRINPMFISGLNSERTRKYLESKVVVQYLNEPPNVDHDGGSVVLNVHTGDAWQT